MSTIRGGDILNDRYEVERMLGQGGMSTVWLGHDPRLNRPVAIKAIHGFLVNHSTFLERFQREAAAIASLNHQHIIQVYDYNQHEDTHYMVLEYVEGNNLKQELVTSLQNKSLWGTESVLKLMIQLTDAVGNAHENGMLHRDLKPDNVMLRLNGEPVLTDFGIIKMLVDDSITRVGTVLGTAAYMAPEQIEGDLVERPADIYALGVILFELMCGQRPFTADSPIQLMLKQTSEPPPALSSLMDESRKDEGLDMEPVIYKALAKAPENRYQTATELRQVLSQVLESLTIHRPRIVSTFQNTNISDPAYLTSIDEIEVTTQSRLVHFVEPDIAKQDAMAEIAKISKLLEVDPLREDQVQQQMMLYARTCNYAGSLQAYTRLQRRFADELGIDPLAETVHLKDSILSARLSQLHNLTPDASQFVGREAELNAIAGRLTSEECRLLTLLGPGGMGKTRIGRAVIRKLASADWRYFLHGAWFVSLAPINIKQDPQALIYAIARACNIPISGKESPETQLFNWFSEREALLVLDNFEHIMSQSDWVDELLQQAPKLRILVTSRQRLNIADEHIYPIYGFSQSPVNSKASPREMLDDGSRLFLLTTRKLQPNFRPGVSDLQSIRRICTLVNGMPLGIELAASWTRMLSCAEIVGEIEKNIDFLESNLKRLPERHRSMRAVFSYSWDLLDEVEQKALMNLSLIKGQFNLETAQAVGDASIDVITSLVDKSLVHAFFGSDSEDTISGRSYSLHEITAHYAKEVLSITPNAWQEAQQRHSDWFLSVLSTQYAEMFGPNQLRAVEGVYFAYDDILDAWQTSLLTFGWSRNDLNTTTLALSKYFQMDGLERLGADIFAKALNTLPTAAPSKLKIILEVSLAGFLYRLAEYDQAEELAQKALASAKRENALAEVGRAFTVLGDINMKIGRFVESIDYGKEVLKIAQQLDDVNGRAIAYNLMGNTSLVSGQFGDAYTWLEEAIRFYRIVGDETSEWRIRARLAIPTVMVGQQHQAMEIIKKDLEISRRWRNKHQLAIKLLNLAWVRTFVGEFKQADEEMDECMVYYRESGDLEGEATAFIVMADVDLKQDDYVAARSHFLDSVNIAYRIQAIPKLVEGIAGLSLFLHEIDNNPELAWKVAEFCRQNSLMGSMGLYRSEEVLQRTKNLITDERKAELIEEVKSYTLNDVASALINHQLNKL
ncbi:MAG: serine/threonine protein kinase/predicted ATPase [Cellvibrionaceae bacterium]|jgi:serine/threonine protein kinase/predicted ATPase